MSAVTVTEPAARSAPASQVVAKPEDRDVAGILIAVEGLDGSGK